MMRKTNNEQWTTHKHVTQRYWIRMHLELESNIKYYVLWYVWLKFHAGEFALYKSSARTSSGRNTCKMTQRKITTYRNVSDLTAQTKIVCTSTTIESKSDTLIFYLFIIFFSALFIFYMERSFFFSSFHSYCGIVFLV